MMKFLRGTMWIAMIGVFAGCPVEETQPTPGDVEFICGSEEFTLPVAEQAASEISVPPSIRLGVYLMNYAGYPEPYPREDAESTFFGAAPSLRTFMNNTSLGQLEIEGGVADVHGWHTFPNEIVPGNCPTGAWTTAVENRFDTSEYDHVAIVVPSALAGCDWAGAAVYGRYSWYATWAAPDHHVLSHELGHNFGLQHARGFDCDDPSSSYCEYSDPWDPMGGGRCGFSAANKSRLGWEEGQNLLSDPAPGLYAIYAPEDAAVTSRPQGIRFSRDNSDGLGSYLVVEKRRADNYPNCESPHAPPSGVQLRVVAPQVGGHTSLIDATPSAQPDERDYFDAGFLAGEEYSFINGAGHEITIYVDALADGGATVSVFDSSSGNPPPLMMGMASYVDGGWFENIDPTSPKDSLGWERVSQFDAYNASGGGARPILCDFDGDGKHEVAIGLDAFPANGGWVQIQDDEDTGFAALGWVRYTSNATYDANNGESRPACGDIDGDHRDELIIGGGTGSSTLLWIFDDAAHQFRRLGYKLLLDDVDYLVGNGETRPVLCDVDGDDLDEIVVGLGAFDAGTGGRLVVFDDALAGHTQLASLQTSWALSRTRGTGTRPACGDIDGDGRDEIVMGFDSGTGGWLEFFDDATAGYGAMGWTRVHWPEYNQQQGETFPACGDLDGDGVDELVVGLGAYPANGGWFEVMDGFDSGDTLDLLDSQVWGRLTWPSYNQTDGAIYPTVGR